MTENTDQPDGPPRTRVAGMSMGAPMVQRMLTDPRSEVTRLTGVPAMAVLTTDSVELEFSGPRSIPQLRIRGLLEAVVAATPDELPYALSQVSLPPQESVMMEAVYHFTTEQIAEMVTKGLYLEGFRPPETWLGLAMELPVETDIVLVAPDETGLPPIVGVDVSRLAALDTSREHSMYDFSAAFEDYRGELVSSGVLPAEDIPGVLTDTELSEEGFDFGQENTVEIASAMILDARADLPAARRQMEVLMGVRLDMPDQLELLRAQERDRVASGELARVREGLVGKDEEQVLSRFHAGVRERARSQGGVPQATEPDLTDEQLVAALSTEGDAEFDLDGLDDYDFGDLDLDAEPGAQAEGPETTDPVEETGFAPDADHEAAGDGLVTELEPITDEESEELDALERMELDPEERDDEADRNRKAALRARRAALRAARMRRLAALERAAEAAASAPVAAPEPVPDSADTPARHRRPDVGPEVI